MNASTSRSLGVTTALAAVLALVSTSAMAQAVAAPGAETPTATIAAAPAPTASPSAAPTAPAASQSSSVAAPAPASPSAMAPSMASPTVSAAPVAPSENVKPPVPQSAPLAGLANPDKPVFVNVPRIETPAATAASATPAVTAAPPAVTTSAPTPLDAHVAKATRATHALAANKPDARTVTPPVASVLVPDLQTPPSTAPMMRANGAPVSTDTVAASPDPIDAQQPSLVREGQWALALAGAIGLATLGIAALFGRQRARQEDIGRDEVTLHDTSREAVATPQPVVQTSLRPASPAPVAPPTPAPAAARMPAMDTPKPSPFQAEAESAESAGAWPLGAPVLTQAKPAAAAAIPSGPVLTGPERQAVLDRMADAEPDDANPFRTRKARLRRARRMLQAQEYALRQKAVEPFDWRRYEPSSALAAREGISLGKGQKPAGDTDEQDPLEVAGVAHV